MLLALGDHHFDVTHRALIVGHVDALESLDRVHADAPVALAATSPALARAVCDRVSVPVGVVISRDRVEFAGRAVTTVGPFPGPPPRRMSGVVDAIVAGERVILSTAVGSDRRVAEVMARILGARTPP